MLEDPQWHSLRPDCVVQLERPVELIREVIKEVPVDRIVEKRVEVPKECVVEQAGPPTSRPPCSHAGAGAMAT